MFENLTDRLSKTLKNISGKGRLTDDNIKDTLREVRMALLEATKEGTHFFLWFSYKYVVFYLTYHKNGCT